MERNTHLASRIVTDKASIILFIRQTTERDSGKAPEREKLENETGIKLNTEHQRGRDEWRLAVRTVGDTNDLNWGAKRKLFASWDRYRTDRYGQGIRES